MNKKIVIIDNDRNYITPLAAGLQHAGFSVYLWDERQDLLEFIRQTRPDMIISEAHLESVDSQEFFKRLKSLPEFKFIPFLFTSSQKNVDERIKNIEIGVDDFLGKPFYVEEAVSRISNLLQELENFGGYQLETERGFTGNLTEMNLVDLIQTMELGKKSAVIKLKRHNTLGEVYLVDGNVVNARLDHLDGEQAILRLFTWTIGVFSVEMTAVTQKRKIQKTNKELIDIGLRRLSSWEQIRQGLPPLQAVIAPTEQKNWQKLSDEEKELLKMIPDKIRLSDLIAKSKFDDLKALELVRSLYQKGSLQETEDNYNHYVEDYLKRVKQNRAAGENSTERAATIVSNILRKTDKDPGQERREQDRRQTPERRFHGRRQGDLAYGRNPIYLSKIELLMIKEALS
ncbi:MAG: response regulator [Calditrichaeota bacterium]|nr:response regulator [Calditrichota bacterium]